MTSSDRSRPRRSVKLVATLLVIVLGLAALELFATVYLTLRDGHYVSPNDRLDAGMGAFLVREAFVAPGSDAPNSGNCRWVDFLFAHPYLAFTASKNPPCPLPNANNVGLIGRDFPAEKDPTAYSILLTGGSVAMLFGQFHLNYPLYLEEELNRCYVPPHGNRFVVYNGAMGDWKQPQESIVYLLYGNLFDAVITLEGANEYGGVIGHKIDFGRFETPDNRFLDVNTAARQSQSYTAALWLGNRIIGTARQNWFMRNSSFAYLAIDAVLQRLRDVVAETQNRPTSVQSIFALPTDWSHERKAHYNLEQYKRQLRMLAAMADANGAKKAFFFQPVPLYHKRLTDEEKTLVGDMRHWVQPPFNYQEMVDQLMVLRAEGVPVHSLTKLFANTEETIYGDPIHYKIDHTNGGESLGYRMMAKAVAESLAKDWGFRRDCSPRQEVLHGGAARVLGPEAVDNPVRGENVTLQLRPDAPVGMHPPSIHVIENTVDDWHRVHSEGSNVSTGDVGFQVTVKAGGRKKLYMDIFDGSGQFVGSPLLDLETGTIALPAERFKQAGSANLGGGWYRFWVIAPISGGPNARLSVGLQPPDKGGRSPYSGDKHGSFFVHSAEIVENPKIVIEAAGARSQ